MRRLLLFCIAALLLLSAFDTRKKEKPKLPAEFIYVPAGTYSTWDPDDNYYYRGKKKATDSSKIISVAGFYMSRYEVSNLQYRQFYNEVSVGMTEEEKEKIACDSLGWRMELNYCEPMVEYYYRHPGYNDYPMSNVSYDGATKYCEWLQQKIQKDNPNFIVEVKIPTRRQWIWAASGGRSQAMYPWGNWYLRNKKGEYLCNFRRVNDHSIVRNKTTGKPEIAADDRGIAGNLSGSAFYTVAVKSFYPNDFGLYNMCGNVAEMIDEKNICVGGSWNDYGGDVQIRAENTYEVSAPTVGFRPLIIVTEKSKQ